MIPEGAQLEASTGYNDEDGWYSDSDVTESLPPCPKPGEDIPPAGVHGTPDIAWWDPWDHRESSLRVSLPSLTVHEIKRVQVSTEAHQVSRWTRRETTTTPLF